MQLSKALENCTQSATTLSTPPYHRLLPLGFPHSLCGGYQTCAAISSHDGTNFQVAAMQALVWQCYHATPAYASALGFTRGMRGCSPLPSHRCSRTRGASGSVPLTACASPSGHLFTHKEANALKPQAVAASWMDGNGQGTEVSAAGTRCGEDRGHLSAAPGATAMGKKNMCLVQTVLSPPTIQLSWERLLRCSPSGDGEDKLHFQPGLQQSSPSMAMSCCLSPSQSSAPGSKLRQERRRNSNGSTGNSRCNEEE